VAGERARLRLHFLARKVHLVLAGQGFVQVFQNGRLKGTVRVNGDRLYTLLTQTQYKAGLVELAFTPRVAAYAFTFG
jgi:hypothetical protein